MEKTKLNEIDYIYMKKSLELAVLAEAQGEVPVGAVVVQFNELTKDLLTGKFSETPLAFPVIVGSAFNLRESKNDPTAHAEIMALQMASQKLGRWRLTGCTLYVTLEPCLMCAGAVILSRVDRVVYGANDPKAGAVESLYKVLTDLKLNHRPEVRGGVDAESSSLILKNFFSKKRGRLA